MATRDFGVFIGRCVGLGTEITYEVMLTAPASTEKTSAFPNTSNSLECDAVFADTPGVDHLASYRKDAMKLAAIMKLGGNEGYVARIPGFRGLLATGRTRKESMAELEDALVDWIDLALRRGTGLPAIKQPRARELTAA